MADSPTTRSSFTILVIQHAVCRSHEAFIVGDSLGNQWHKRRRIFVKRPGQSSHQQETVHGVEVGIGIVTGRRTKDPALAGLIGPKGVTAGIFRFQNVRKRYFAFERLGSERPNGLNVVPRD